MTLQNDNNVLQSAVADQPSRRMDRSLWHRFSALQRGKGTLKFGHAISPELVSFVQGVFHRPCGNSGYHLLMVIGDGKDENAFPSGS